MAIAIAISGILLTLAIDQTAAIAISILNESDFHKPRHFEPVDQHVCSSLSNLRSRNVENHEHNHDHATDTKHNGGVVVNGDQTSNMSLSICIGKEDRYNPDLTLWKGRTVEEDEEFYGHSHKHLHIPHDCHELGKIVIITGDFL